MVAFWRFRTIRFIFLLGIFGCIGFLRGMGAISNGEMAGRYRVIGQIGSFSRSTSSGRGYGVKVDGIQASIFVQIRDPESFLIGDRVVVVCRLVRNTPGESGFSRFLFAHGFAYRCQEPDVSIHRIGERDMHSLEVVGDRIRRKSIMYAYRALPWDEAVLFLGMFIGERDSFSAQDREAMRIAGVSHLTVVSGQNVVFVANLLLSGFFFLGLKRKYASSGVILAVFAFAFFVGNDASVLRAAVMYASMVCAYFFERPGIRYYVVSATAWIMLLVSPQLVFDLGFWLSFGAVFGLMAYTHFWSRWFPRKTPQYIRDTFASTLAAQTGVFPILISTFGSVSLLAPCTNVLILVVVPWILSYGTVFLTLIPFMPEWVVHILAYGLIIPLRYIRWVIDVAALFPAGEVHTDNVWVRAGSVVVFCCVVIFVRFWKRLRARFRVHHGHDEPPTEYHTPPALCL